MIFYVFIFVFLFRTNGKEEHLDESNFITVMVIIWKVPIGKLKFFLNNYKAYWQWHLKGTFQLKILQTWSTYFLILSLVNIMKQKWVKVSGKWSVAQKFWNVPRRTFYLDIYLLLHSYFSLKQTLFLNST